MAGLRESLGLLLGRDVKERQAQQVEIEKLKKDWHYKLDKEHAEFVLAQIQARSNSLANPDPAVEEARVILSHILQSGREQW